MSATRLGTVRGGVQRSGLGLPTISSENTGRIKPSAESARCGAPKARRSRRRRRRRGGSWEGFGKGLCPSPENFPDFYLEIACYGAFWKQFFKLDDSLFTSVSSVSRKYGRFCVQGRPKTELGSGPEIRDVQGNTRRLATLLQSVPPSHGQDDL